MTGRMRDRLGACAAGLILVTLPLTVMAQSERRPGGVENVQTPPGGVLEGTRGVKRSAPATAAPPAPPAAAPSMPAPSPQAPAAKPSMPPAAKDGKSSEVPAGGAAPSRSMGATRGPSGSGGSSERRVGGVENVQTKGKE